MVVGKGNPSVSRFEQGRVVVRVVGGGGERETGGGVTNTI